MKLEHVSAKTLREHVLPIIKKYHIDSNKYNIFFFGSRVVGNNSEYSDIDLGIDGPTPLDPVTFSNIQEDIEQLPFLYRIDLVDFQRVSPEFRMLALKHIETL